MVIGGILYLGQNYKYFTNAESSNIFIYTLKLSGNVAPGLFPVNIVSNAIIASDSLPFYKYGQNHYHLHEYNE